MKGKYEYLFPNTSYQEKMEYLKKVPIELNLLDFAETAQICKALSSETRLQILQYLSKRAASISVLAQELNIPMSTMTMHIRLLKEANLISTTSLPGLRGTQIRCGISAGSVFVDFTTTLGSDLSASAPLQVQEMPVGNFFDYQATAPCGMVSYLKCLIPDDIPNYFSTPTRMEAQLIWMTAGYLEYRFFLTPDTMNAKIERIEYSFEICSETYSYNESWRSDVTIWINNQEIGILECPGDYGGRRGKLNPEWWPDLATQFGDISHITITNEGCIINNNLIKSHNLSSLGIGRESSIIFKLGVKPDARYAGGFNLFGEKFGDHSQSIVMQIYGRK